MSGTNLTGKRPSSPDGGPGSTPGSRSTAGDLRVYLKFKNAALLQAIEDNFEDMTLADIGEHIGVNYQYLCGLINLRVSPFAKRRGVWVEGVLYTATAIKLSEYFLMEPAKLFPASLYKLKLPKDCFKEFSSTEILYLQEARAMKLLPSETYEHDYDAALVKEDIDQVLRYLTPREERVVRMFFGIGTEEAESLAAIGRELGLIRSRSYQILGKALRKLRHPLLKERWSDA